MSWTPKHAEQLAQLMPDLWSELTTKAPRLSATTVEETAMLARDRNGYEQCMNQLRALATEAPTQMSSPYVQGLEMFDQAPMPDAPGLRTP